MKIKFYPTKNCTLKNNVNGFRYTKKAYGQFKEKITNAIKKNHCAVMLPGTTLGEIKLENIYGFVTDIDFNTSEITVNISNNNQWLDVSKYSADTVKYAVIENKEIKEVTGFHAFILRLNSEFEKNEKTI